MKYPDLIIAKPSPPAEGEGTACVPWQGELKGLLASWDVVAGVGLFFYYNGKDEKATILF
jgi:hypothetical protein